MHTIDKSQQLKIVERLLAALILFNGAAIFCLPVPATEEIAALYPWWGKRIAIGNVQLHELLFLGWLALYGWRYVLRVLSNGGAPMRQAAVWLIALALWCGLISLTAPIPLLDLGRSFRLVLNAVLLLAIVRWARRTGEFPLAMLILGFLFGTLINLVLSFRYPMIVLDTMRLSGQNTPGVAMGIAIHLCAWLFFRAGHYKSQMFAVVAAFVFVFGCAISYSRIGWFGGGLGLLSWAYILFFVRLRNRSEQSRLKRVRFVLVPLLAFGLTGFLSSPLGQEGLLWIQTLAAQKLENQGDSNTQRWAYAIGTIEIISRHPFGVGYSGFFDAMTATDIYRTGMAPEEESMEDANPHAAFLWYTTAGGIPGGVIAILVFALLLNGMRFGLVSAMGRPGWILFALAVPAFLAIALTVTYLLNSLILIAPAGIAAGWGWTRRLQLAESLHFTIDNHHAQKTLRSPSQSPAVS